MLPPLCRRVLRLLTVQLQVHDAARAAGEREGDGDAQHGEERQRGSEVRFGAAAAAEVTRDGLGRLAEQKKKNEQAGSWLSKVGKALWII